MAIVIEGDSLVGALISILKFALSAASTVVLPKTAILVSFCGRRLPRIAQLQMA